MVPWVWVTMRPASHRYWGKERRVVTVLVKWREVVKLVVAMRKPNTSTVQNFEVGTQTREQVGDIPRTNEEFVVPSRISIGYKENPVGPNLVKRNSP